MHGQTLEQRVWGKGVTWQAYFIQARQDTSAWGRQDAEA